MPITTAKLELSYSRSLNVATLTRASGPATTVDPTRAAVASPLPGFLSRMSKVRISSPALVPECVTALVR